jgi:hypothetical protein
MLTLILGGFPYPGSLEMHKCPFSELPSYTDLNNNKILLIFQTIAVKNILCLCIRQRWMVGLSHLALSVVERIIPDPSGKQTLAPPPNVDQ